MDTKCRPIFYIFPSLADHTGHRSVVNAAAHFAMKNSTISTILQFHFRNNIKITTTKNSISIPQTWEMTASIVNINKTLSRKCVVVYDLDR